MFWCGSRPSAEIARPSSPRPWSPGNGPCPRAPSFSSSSSSRRTTVRKHRLGAAYAARPPIRHLKIDVTMVDTVINCPLIVPLFANVRSLVIDILTPPRPFYISLAFLASMLIACPNLKSLRLSPAIVFYDTRGCTNAQWDPVSSIISGLEKLDFRPRPLFGGGIRLTRVLWAVRPRLRKWVLDGTENLGGVPDGGCPNLEVLELAGESFNGYVTLEYGDFCADIARIAPSVRVLRSQIDADQDRAKEALLMLPTIEALELPGADLRSSTYDGLVRALHYGRPLTVLRVSRSVCVESEFISYVALHASRLRILHVGAPLGRPRTSSLVSPATRPN
ncbi:hypothetical protein BDK51DRAFT_35025 [Blyttiomyces helicus]|uniref:F-box domain-containing protein n=1 Tax=Blyttiomyces helicus TaxID=388810 RepID=A0A4P9VYH1_9FUNG|nr:hypothetical protein BDK51DRAFT_35025 [Blyttiomyces helicus]|eukprot:RKO84831.1 hypothetical protein BDK51DRAFT_35025 [Blyttiomyces helicus]